MGKVEEDLQRSKSIREKQSKGYQKQIEKIRIEKDKEVLHHLLLKEI